MNRIILAGLLACSSFAAAQNYKIIDLGPLVPVGINIEGEVAGNLNGNAAVWTSTGGTKMLGTLPGGTFSQAAAINDVGVVTGTADGPGMLFDQNSGFVSCEDLTQPFTWTQSRGFVTAQSVPIVFDLGPVCSRQDDYVNGINLYGQVVGSNIDYATYKYGYVWSKSGLSLLKGFYQTNANAINDFGQVAGQVSNFLVLYDQSHASFWNNGKATDLGTLAGGASNWSACSGATSVNDLDLVVGWSGTATSTGSFPCNDLLDASTPVHAFIWQPRTGMHDLGSLPGDRSSAAQKINLLGIVIGSSGNQVIQDPQNEYSIQVVGHPFIWSEGRGVQNLNSLINPNQGWTLNSVADINVWDQVVGTGTYRGETHGFLITPVVLFRY
jgi:uncharacterized membrane protein